MKFGSVFAGIGGFDLGLEQSGMECAWQIEKDKYATQVLERHWPNVTRYTDVIELTGDELQSVDLMAGGFPCQDLSIAGKKEGIHGERSGLFFDFMRFVRVVGPRYVLLENVPNLLTKPEWMGAVLGELAECGYDAEWRVLDSRRFGVCQRRNRVFIVGYSRDRCTEKVFPIKKPNQEYLSTDAKVGDGSTGGFGTFYACMSQFEGKYERSGVVSTLLAEDDAVRRGGLIVTPDGRIRSLTTAEGERLQGFPDGWTSGFTANQRWKMIGNAVTVPVVKWIGERIMESARTSPRPQAQSSIAHPNV